MGRRMTAPFVVVWASSGDDHRRPAPLMARPTAAATDLKLPPLPMPPTAQMLPTTISIRSTQYHHYTGMVARGILNRYRPVRVSDPVFIGPHRIFEGRGNKENGIVLEVYMEGTPKTELCRNWQRRGRCMLSSKDCLFAHGVAELRPVLRPAKYKTQPCRFIASGRCCPYGDRCQFIHPCIHLSNNSSIVN